MSTFYWRSQALEQCGPGWIAAEGTDVDEARGKVRAYAESWFTDSRPWFNPADADDLEDRAAFVALVETDIKPEPDTHIVLFINGSE